MKRTILSLTAVLLCLLGNAQSFKADSLIQMLKTSLNDTVRVNIYTKLASEFLNRCLPDGVTYSDSAIHLSKAIGFYKGAITGYRLKGVAFAYQGDNYRAKEIFKSALSLATAHNVKTEVVKSYNNLGNIYNALNNYDSSIYFSQKSLLMDSSVRNKKYVFLALANVYRQKSDYATSLIYHLKNLSLCRQVGDKIFEAKILQNIGNVHGMIKQYDEALHYFKEAAKIMDTVAARVEYGVLNMNIGNIYAEKKEFTQAEKYFQIALRVNEKIKGVTAQVLINLANAYSDQSLYSKAAECCDKARIIAKELKNEDLLAQINIGFAYVYFGLNKLNESVREANEGLARCNTLGIIPLKVQAFTILHRVDSVRGNYMQALQNYKQADAIEDSLFTVEKSRQIVDIKEKYEAEKKAREILNLENEVERNQNSLSKETSKLYGVGILFLTTLCLVTFIFFRIRAKNEKEAQKNSIRLHKALILAQEDVQDKISRDLHDNIGQKVVALKMNLENNNSDKSSFNIPELLTDITKSIREVSHTLSSHQLQAEGLYESIHKMLNVTFNNSSIEYTFESFNLSDNYPYEVEVNVYRIGQELISNVITHAFAKNVIIQLYESATHLILVVEDDGKGFNSPIKKGFGLNNIGNRVQMLKGVFHYSSESGKTTSTIRIPL